jgi:hypothetical protein
VKVLVACEFSGVVRRAFREKGHDAWSCDLLESEDDSPYHHTGDVNDLLGQSWDLIIAHPPCTYLAVSGNKHYANRPDLYEPAAEFAMSFMDYAPKVCIENPIGRLSRLYRKPDQIIQPWMFGHEATKSTCLWLKNLPLLEATNIVSKGSTHTTKSGKRLPSWYNLPPSADRSRIRSRTFEGIGRAMADYWG